MHYRRHYFNIYLHFCFAVDNWLVIVDVKFKPDAFKFSVMCTGSRFQCSYAFTIGLSDPVESRLSSTMGPWQIWSLGLGVSRDPQNSGGALGPAPLRRKCVWPLINMLLPFFCYFAEFSCCRSNRWASEGVKNILRTLSPPLKMSDVFDPLETRPSHKSVTPQIRSFYVKRLVRNYGDPLEKFDP